MTAEERIRAIANLLPPFGMFSDAHYLAIGVDDLRFLLSEAEAAQRARRLAEEWRREEDMSEMVPMPPHGSKSLLKALEGGER